VAKNCIRRNLQSAKSKWFFRIRAINTSRMFNFFSNRISKCNKKFVSSRKNLSKQGVLSHAKWRLVLLQLIYSRCILERVYSTTTFHKVKWLALQAVLIISNLYIVQDHVLLRNIAMYSTLTKRTRKHHHNVPNTWKTRLLLRSLVKRFQRAIITNWARQPKNDSSLIIHKTRNN